MPGTLRSPIERNFASHLTVDPEDLWQDATSLPGINAELAPYLQMRSVDGLTRLYQLQTEVGLDPFLVDLRLGGVLPVGRARIVIVDLGRWHFTERSDQPGMASWQHRREVSPTAEGSLLIDRLRFTPAFAPQIGAAAIGLLFAHRHRRLRTRWGGRAA